MVTNRRPPHSHSSRPELLQRFIRHAWQQSLALSQKQLLATNSALRELALQDGLTGLPTYPSSNCALTKKLPALAASRMDLSLCVFTLDHGQKTQQRLS